ncbi:hypothetical protein AAA799P11_00136 [Marine Group I thaumarchaeote SCGC AAA799-P11]|uniref:Uncharacterized protein n=1 Tax=Marine Group I thaumarchaeote SCGC AAA799-P11 TaxID=1502295 RepID=A0A087S3T5_9ARCH|nr:hypothetical protein AAA799P11_00136 [Marine Group I thaumarchaeote SCGC AAA799-P11]
MLNSADVNIRTKVIWELKYCMTKLQQLQKLVEEKGELMVMSDTGEKFELHKHNVKFDESSDLVEIDGGTKKFWLIPSKIAYYWTHDKAREE